MTSDEVFDEPQEQDDNAAKAGDRLFGKEKIFSNDQRTGSDGNAPRDIPSLHLGTRSSGAATAEAGVEGGGAQDDTEAVENQEKPVSLDGTEDETAFALSDDSQGSSKAKEAANTSDQAPSEALPDIAARSPSSPLSATLDRTAAAELPSDTDGDAAPPSQAKPDIAAAPPAEEEPSDQPAESEPERPDGMPDPMDPITMINRAPVAVADTGTTSETASITVDVLANDTDLDAGDSLSLSSVSVASGSGSVSIVGGEVQYDPGTAYDHLAVGETAVVEIDYVVTDGGGLADTGRLTVTVTGSNDGPVVASALADQSATEDAAFSYQVPASSFSDVDVSDTLSYTATLVDGSALPGWLSFDAGTRTFSGTPENGDVGSIDVRVTATDPHGSSVDDVFTLTTANTNDAPDDLTLLRTAVPRVPILSPMGGPSVAVSLQEASTGIRLARRWATSTMPLADGPATQVFRSSRPSRPRSARPTS